MIYRTRPRAARVWRSALVVAVVAVAASGGCAADEPGGHVDPEFAALLDDELAGARAAGASEEQIAILEEARRTGEISFEVYNEAVDRALRCIRETGTNPFDGGVIEHEGVQMRSYGVPEDAEAAHQAEPRPGWTVHQCVAEHSFWVESAYQRQPSSVEAMEAYFDQYRDAIVACLTEHGVDVDPDGSREEIMRLDGQAYLDGRLDNPCSVDAGYNIPEGAQ